MSDTSFEAMNSLEERVSVFFDENYSDEFIQGVEYDQISEDDDEDLIDSEERAIYWESQHSLLQEVLERYSSMGSKMRKEVSRTIDAAARESTLINGCHCSKPKSDGCNHCLRQQVVDRFRDKGITATLCTSKWKDTKNFPRGSHEYIELIGNTMNRKKRIAFVVEVEFRDQFEIAKACKEYRKLVSDLPEYYVGKPEYLQTVVRLVCEAAKASLKERRIHMGPWRKTSFMLMKWSANSSALTLTDTSDDLRPYSQIAVVAT